MSDGGSDMNPKFKTNVLTVGIAVVDHVFRMDCLPKRAEKHFANDQFDVAGGIAVNAALAIQSLNGQAFLLSRVGGDGAGFFLEETLSRSGIDLSLLEVCRDRRSATSAVLMDSSGERMIVNYRSDALFSKPPELPAAVFRSMQAVLGDLRWTEATTAAFEMARRADVPTVLDFDLNNKTIPKAILETSDYIVFAEAALRRFARRTHVVSALRIAQTLLPDVRLAVTCGQDGVHFITGDGRLLKIPARNVKVCSTLGAGDVFHGALALAIAEGSSFETALRFANDVAALRVSSPPNQSAFPSRADVEKFQRSAA
ncbi:MAG: PfkB family carbohydrate kinase [Rhodobacteraceae bacterium]|nr:PfkB family carbohydrate kinase [Paracoccaceae bacterium]